MDPLIVTVAPVGAELTPEQTPHLAVKPAQLGEVFNNAVMEKSKFFSTISMWVSIFYSNSSMSCPSGMTNSHDTFREIN